MSISIGIVEDQLLVLKSLSALLQTMPGIEVVVEATNGRDLLDKLATGPEPDMLLVDVEMPVMNGVETAREITERYPCIKMAALTMRHEDMHIISMLNAGCTAYLLKDINSTHLENAIHEIHQTGFYGSNIEQTRRRRLADQHSHQSDNHLTDRELHFLQLAATESTYKEIAAEMHLSERTIDGYRESVFKKLGVQSRVGMVIDGLKKGIIQLHKNGKIPG